VALVSVALVGYGTVIGFKAIKNSLSFCKEKDYGCYVGQVAERKPHGLGAAQTRPDTTLPVNVYAGEWIQGVLEEGTFILADRTKYNGKWVPFKVINGELHDIDSSSLISTFILNGEGVIYGVNGVLKKEKWKQFPYASQKSDAPMVDFTNVLVVSSCKTESSDNRSANCVLERRFDEKQHSNPKRFSLVAAHHN
jgi:hypothetical protein